jgi:pyroglutamyl-peptidase
MRLLLTGFEPFGGERVNPSEEVVRAIADAPPEGIELTTRVLPVRPRSAFDHLLPVLEAGDFDAWLGLGEAGGRAYLSVERVGINVFVDAALPADERREVAIVEGGPAGYFARLALAELVGRMQEAGAPSVASNTAGTYCCNESLYAVQHYLERSGRAMPSGFIHLPYLPEQTVEKAAGTPSMALETQVLGVRAAIELLRDRVAARASELTPA